MGFEGRVQDSWLRFQICVVGVPYVVGRHHIVEFGREYSFGGQHGGRCGLVFADDGRHVVFRVRLVRVKSVGVVELWKKVIVCNR